MQETELAAALRQVPCGEHPNRLRIALTVINKTQAEVADALGMNQGHFSQLVTGRRTPSMPTARRLAGYFGVPVEVLFPERPAA